MMAALGKFVAYLLVLLFVNMIVASFAHTQTAINAAEADGLTHIHVLSDNWGFPEIDGCTPIDPKEVTLTATNLRGEEVMVHVCITEWHDATGESGVRDLGHSGAVTTLLRLRAYTLYRELRGECDGRKLIAQQHPSAVPWLHDYSCLQAIAKPSISFPPLFSIRGVLVHTTKITVRACYL
jgi:hypothetical protein